MTYCPICRFEYEAAPERHVRSIPHKKNAKAQALAELRADKGLVEW